MVDLTNLVARIRRAGGLPVFDSSLQSILEAIHHDLPMAEIARGVESDPGLAGRLLKLANSAYYGMSKEVSTLKMALVLLGSRTLRNMVLGIGMSEVLEDTGTGDYPGTGFREHGVRTGKAASYLARLHGLNLQGEEFVAGLVHDVGQLVLLRAFPEVVASDDGPSFATPSGAPLSGQQLLAVEKAVFGITHPEAGAWAAQEWRLPESIVNAIASHHAAEECKASEPADKVDGASNDIGVDAGPGLTALVAAADQLVRYLDEADGSAEKPDAWSGHPVLGHDDLDLDAVLREFETELIP